MAARRRAHEMKAIDAQQRERAPADRRWRCPGSAPVVELGAAPADAVVGDDAVAGGAQRRQLPFPHQAAAAGRVQQHDRRPGAAGVHVPQPPAGSDANAPCGSPGGGNCAPAPAVTPAASAAPGRRRAAGSPVENAASSTHGSCDLTAQLISGELDDERRRLRVVAVADPPRPHAHVDQIRPAQTARSIRVDRIVRSASAVRARRPTARRRRPRTGRCARRPACRPPRTSAIAGLARRLRALRDEPSVSNTISKRSVTAMPTTAACAAAAPASPTPPRPRDACA